MLLFRCSWKYDATVGGWRQSYFEKRGRKVVTKPSLDPAHHIDILGYMESLSAIEAFAALSQPTRLDAFRLLTRHEPHGLPAGEVARLLGVPQNTMSSHLAILSRAELIDAERHGRSIIYRADLERVRELASFLVTDCCGGRPELCNPLAAQFTQSARLRRQSVSATRVYNVLFLCTGNSARSILGEAMLNHVANGRFRAFSAGSIPRGEVHPMSLEVLAAAGISVEGLRSKSWEEFAGPDAPKMDFVFTVCDNAAGEACPIWPGQPMTAHWGIEDPAAVEGPEFRQRAAFEDAMGFMRNRIAAFTSLPLERIDTLALGSKLRAIGALDGATSASKGAA
jgi:arsenate reductase